MYERDILERSWVSVQRRAGKLLVFGFFMGERLSERRRGDLRHRRRTRETRVGGCRFRRRSDSTFTTELEKRFLRDQFPPFEERIDQIETHLDSQLPTGMAVVEKAPALFAILFPTEFHPTQRERERIADRQRRDDAAGRSRERRVGFVRRAGAGGTFLSRVHARARVEPAIARAREDRIGIARDGDEGSHARADDREEAHELGRRARVRNEEDDIARRGRSRSER